jgi:alkanesulfonate monooxygenase SsuD/methylene tetrahydromethanopterin reductase-like flavin-dependent oxidoreductase (luciferase family)
VGGPRLLAALGRCADGWVPSNSYFSPEKLPALHARIDEAAVAAGRDPALIQRLYNVFGTITDRESGGFLQGPAEQWVDELTTLVIEQGMDSFIFGPASEAVRQVQRFAAEIAPAVREAVARHRGGGDT